MHTNDWRTGSDAGLDELFAAVNRDLPPEPFATSVMQSVRRSARRRALRACVIACALIIGVALAAAAGAGVVASTLVELLARLGAVSTAVQWSAVEGLGADWMAATQMYRVPVLVVLCCALAWPVLARLAAR